MRGPKRRTTGCHQDRLRVVTLIHLLMLPIGALLGCGGGTPPAPAENAAEPVAETVATTPEPDTTSDTSEESRNSDAETADSSKTKWLGKIPYDVFYNRPADLIGQTPELGASVQVVSTTAPAAAMDTAMASPQAAGGDESEATAAGADTAAARWQTIIPGDLLDEESKLIRTRLTENLLSVATYNNSIDAIGTDSQVLAALAGIAERTSGDVRWKDRAPVIRSLADEVYNAVGARGGKAFRETQTPFDKLRDAMDGARVDEDAEAGVPLSDYAYRSSMMIRIKQSSDWLRTEVSTESRLNDEEVKRSAMREASLLAALGEAVAQPGYDYSDEEEYAQMTADYVAAALGIREAAEAGDFAGFQSSYKSMMKQCGVCHGRYQFQ